MDEHTVSVLRGTGLKDSISPDRVAKSPRLRSTVEDATNSLADSRDDGETPSSGRTPGGGEDTAGTAVGLPWDDIEHENNARDPALATAHAPGLMNAVEKRAPQRVISRLAYLPCQIREKRLPRGRTTTTAPKYKSQSAGNDLESSFTCSAPYTPATTVDKWHCKRS